MLKIDKNLISTYLVLNNQKADEYLAKIANEILKDLEIVDDNNKIIELLDILAELAYRVPNRAIDIVEYVVNHPYDSKTIESPFGKYQNKNYTKVVVKALDVLDHIRYIHPDGVLPLLARLTLSHEKEISTGAQEVLKHFVKYDINALTQIGYSAQRKAFDFVLAWTQEEQLRHIDFVETVLRDVLNCSVEGTTSGLNDDAEYTITMHSGVVSPTDFLKRMRREVIDLTYELYKATEDPKLKLKLVSTFDEAGRTPLNVLYGDDVTQMIIEDIRYLGGIYRKIIFGDTKDQMTDHLGIVATIEERLYWINRSEKRRIEETEKLRRDILQNDLYKIFRLLVGDPITYREEEGWDTAEKSRGEEINQRIDSITQTSLEEWFERLNKISSQHTIIEEWKFNIFKDFIRKLSAAKPQIADELLGKAFKINSPLKHFIGGFLEGFRLGSHFEKWDKYASKIISAEDVELVTALVFSLHLPKDADTEKLIRESDIDHLENITKEENQFSFLKKTDDRILQYRLFNTLARNFRYFPKRIESLIIDQIKNHPQHLNMFFSELSMVTHMKWFAINELRSESIEFLKEKMIDIPDIDWHIQGVLLEISEQYGLDSVLDVFMKRIRKDEKKKEKEGWRIDERYDAIPYHFNPSLRSFIANHPQYAKIAGEWAAEMTIDWSIYNSHVGDFLKRIGKGFDEIITSLIQKGDDDSLLKATRALHSIDRTNFDLCIEIVRRTDNQRILSQIDSNMYSTGVVSGEYGIAKAYEGKANALEKYKTDESKRVKKFVERMIKSFLESAKRERQHTDEEKQLRRVEFNA